MKSNYVIGILLLVMMLGGCNLMEKLPKTIEQENREGNPGNNYEEAFFVPVQDYKGEDFALHPEGDKSLAVVEGQEKEVEEEVKSYFQEIYHADVTVHNIVGTENGISVFVEATGDPYFTGIGILPVDVSEKEVRYDHLSTMEGQVEDGISAGLYAMAYPEAFANLDQLLEEFEAEYPVTTWNQEVVTHVKGNGYSTPYYFLTTLDPVFENLYERYDENPDLTAEEVESYLEANPFSTEYLVITINLYMEESDVDPDEGILDTLVTLIEEADDIPKGAYSVSLHDNQINARTARGHKDNSLLYEFILKE